jgi:hypothetical protein
VSGYQVTSFGGTEFAEVDESCPPSRYRFTRIAPRPLPLREAEALYARVARYTTRVIDVREVP